MMSASDDLATDPIALAGEEVTLSIVVPVFRNSQSLQQLYMEIMDVRSSCFPQVKLEIVFVDDGSDDGSWEILMQLKLQDPGQVSVHRLSRNFGQLSAMVAGYELATGDALVSISADLQDPTELVGEMVKRWLNGDEIVIANRTSRTDSRVSSVTSRLAYAYARRSTPNIPEGGFDFFLMSNRARELLLQFKGRFRFLQGDLLWLGLPTSFIPYERRARPFGKSAYTWSRRFGNFTDVVIDSSYGPIKTMSRLGLLTAILGGFYIISILVVWIVGGSPFQGWAPIMMVMLVGFGLIMMMMGLIGEYLWRIYDQVRERPMHVVIESHYANGGVNAD